MYSLHPARILPLLLLLAAPAAAQRAPEPEPDEESGTVIEFSGFFVEEAYNQERGMLQQIARVTAVRHGSWGGRYSQEWPVFDERRQLELAALVNGEDGLAGLGAELRFLLAGGEDAVFTLSPGVEAAWERDGEWEIELMVPASVRLFEGLVASTNAAFSVHPEDGGTSWQVGQGLIWRAHPRLNFLLEGVYSHGESVLEGADEEDEGFIVSPGVQVAFPLGEDAQLVPGIAFPVGAGPSSGQRAVMFYLSLEHPFGRRR